MAAASYDACLKVVRYPLANAANSASAELQFRTGLRRCLSRARMEIGDTTGSTRCITEALHVDPFGIDLWCDIAFCLVQM